MSLLLLQDFEALQGRADGRTAFYEALSRSLAGVKDNELLKEAAAWFYSLDHSPSPAGYSLFSRALNNATRSERGSFGTCGGFSTRPGAADTSPTCVCCRDLFIVCPSLHMARHWADSRASVFLYHQPSSSTYHRYRLHLNRALQHLLLT